jgi:hypothetical protein
VRPLLVTASNLRRVAQQTRTILLRGGPYDGQTLAQVPANAPDVDYLGCRYVSTTDEAPRPNDPGEPGPGGVRVVATLPVYAFTN